MAFQRSSLLPFDICLAHVHVYQLHQFNILNTCRNHKQHVHGLRPEELAEIQ